MAEPGSARTAEMSNVEWFVPGSVATIVIAALATPFVARRLGCPRPVALLLLVAVGVIAAATLTPLRALAAEGILVEGCDFRRVGFAPLSDLGSVNDTSLNILLFVPLGLAVGLLPWRWRTLGVAIAAVSLPFVIEATQLVATGLHRGCQSADVVDNLTGLIAGMGVGSIVRFVATGVRRRSA